jgi:LPXTG-site transpeptidase (sortase) family protein
VGISALPPAPALPEVADEGPIPAQIEIGALDVASVPVVAVGVEGNGDMEIPGVDEVGWYRFGSRPGEPGSTVLAAHIAYDGVDGVFRHLDDLEAGDEVVLTDDAGTVSRFVVTEVAQYPKTALPDRVFATDGDPGLVLVTCGGAFDAGAGHYEDNVIAFAAPA